MHAITPTARVVTAVAVVLIGSIAGTSAAAERLVYDLAWDGPETSLVREWHGIGPFEYPIRGTIAVILEPDSPRLENVDSEILIPPDVPAPISVPGWEHLDYHVGSYLSDDLSGDISMVFYPNPVIDTLFPLFELNVDLTEGRRMLSMTGGIPSAFPEEGVYFCVSGRRIPEPVTALLAAIGVAAIIASRRHR
jgi:hypothetical protein